MALTLKPAVTFEFTQVTPSATWVIAHNLDLYPVIDVYIDVSGEQQKMIPLTVEYTDANTCTVTFSSPESGLATLV